MPRRTYKFWLDKLADEILEDERSRKLKVLRVECGIGASGIPHVGSVSDALRAYGVKLALEDRGYRSELIVYADDRDGLRKVPMGLPDELKRYLGFPVTNIPDPFKCHDSFGEHVESLLLEALDDLGLDYTFVSGTAAYKRGDLNREIERILLNSNKIREIDLRLTGAVKGEDWLYYWPICGNCGKIYTTYAYKVLPDERKVLYKCNQDFNGVTGCGYEGEAKYIDGRGKLAWKGEWAARWASYKIIFEARGKDIEDSFRVNCAISKEILKYNPPHSIMYELFLGKSGQKISKSIGNVFTPQVWLRYGSPQSLRLLMFKRYQGTRKLGVDDIPVYMDELDKIEDKYFNLKSISNQREKVRIKRLYEYVMFLKPRKKPSIHVPYNVGVELVSSIPRGVNRGKMFSLFLYLAERQKIVSKKLEREEIEDLKIRFKLLRNWCQDYFKYKEFSLSPKTLEALKYIISNLNTEKNPEDVQSLFFEASREFGFKHGELFKGVYRVLIGKDRGPKISTYVRFLGVELFKDLLVKRLEEALHETKQRFS